MQRAEIDDQWFWRALADPTRRTILGLLRERPRTTGEVAAEFSISRIAVMRHLDLLAGAGLVTSRKRGRQRWHYVNVVPMVEAFQSWVDPVSGGLAASMLRLRDGVEGSVSADDLSVDIAIDVSIAASPAAVFEAITSSPGAWWGHPFLRPESTGLALDPVLGGMLTETWPEGGHAIATITGLASDSWIQLTGSFHLGVAVAVADIRLVGNDDATVVELTFRAFGPVDEALAAAFADGWRELFGERLKAYVEGGTRLGIDSG